MSYKKYQMQLKDHVTGEAIISSGGVAYVTVAGDSAKQTIYSDAVGTAASNPVALTRGKIEFYTLATVDSVDLYIQAPGGQFAVVRGVQPMGPNEIAIDTNQRQQTMVIPFDVADQTGDATETDSGFNVPDNALLLPNPGLRITTADATETIDVGTGGTSNDPNGFLAAASVATLGPVKGTLLNSGVTMGALFFVQDSGNAGDAAPEGNVSAQADNDDITWTLTTGADTAGGFIYLPYLLLG